MQARFPFRIRYTGVPPIVFGTGPYSVLLSRSTGLS